jgi:hypothetical protein
VNTSLDGARSTFKFMKLLWRKCDTVTIDNIDNYQSSLDNLLQKINIPLDLFARPHVDFDPASAIDRYCDDDIFSFMHRAESECIRSPFSTFAPVKSFIHASVHLSEWRPALIKINS